MLLMQLYALFTSLAVILLVVNETQCFDTLPRRIPRKVRQKNEAAHYSFGIPSSTHRTSEILNSKSPIKLKPLSFNPVLFESTEAILTGKQCLLIKQWLRSQTKLDFEALQVGLEKREEGAILLKAIQQTLGQVLAITEDESEAVVPRYISYNEEGGGSLPESLEGYRVEDLLSDGLHVDTNNSKHFRHWTILLYLDSCDRLGATTFPLALPLSKSDTLNCQSEAQRAAEILIRQDVHHTRATDATEDQIALGKVVDNAALDLLKNHGLVESGVRVIPKEGHFCLFSGLTGAGFPNALSFHGGETMDKGESKELLTFFFEVPIELFGSQEELGERVIEREGRFLELHRVH